MVCAGLMTNTQQRWTTFTHCQKECSTTASPTQQALRVTSPPHSPMQSSTRRHVSLLGAARLPVLCPLLAAAEASALLSCCACELLLLLLLVVPLTPFVWLLRCGVLRLLPLL